MHIASVGIELGKTNFHLAALSEHNKFLLRKKLSRPQPLAYTANLPASNRSRGMRGIALHRYCAARARAPGAAHPCAVRQTLPQVEQERLHRCGSDRRSRDQAEHEFCADQNAGATRLASHAPCARPTAAASHGADQT